LKILVAALTAVVFAGCSEKPHEPVRVIAAPRAAPLAAAPDASIAAAETPPVARAVSEPQPQARSPSPPASRNVDVARPGLITGAAAPPRHQPGEPTGNDAFRRAIEAKRAATP
jgi:hypothetical protein